jgi:hypothetical protein
MSMVYCAGGAVLDVLGGAFAAVHERGELLDALLGVAGDPPRLLERLHLVVELADAVAGAGDELELAVVEVFALVLGRLDETVDERLALLDLGHVAGEHLIGRG